MIGALIMVHGDDKGLRLPPLVAPIQVVVVPIGRGEERNRVLAHARALVARLREIVRIKLDDRDEFTPGYKFNDWEMRGVPLRIEIGPKDIAKNEITLARRDTGTKISVAEDQLMTRIPELLKDVQDELFRQAHEFQQAHSYAIDNYQEMDHYGYRGFFRGDWCGSEDCATRLKTETGITIRCLPLEESPVTDHCVVCDEPSQYRALFARAY